MSRKLSQKLEERRRRLLHIIETEFSSNAEFCRKMDLSHNWVNYFKNEDEPPAIHDRIFSSLYELKNISPLWIIAGEGEKKLPAQTQNESESEPEGVSISNIKQVIRLLDRIEQQEGEPSDIELPAGLALQCSRLTTRLLEYQQGGRSDRDE